MVSMPVRDNGLSSGVGVMDLVEAASSAARFAFLLFPSFQDMVV